MLNIGDLMVTMGFIQGQEIFFDTFKFDDYCLRNLGLVPDISMIQVSPIQGSEDSTYDSDKARTSDFTLVSTQTQTPVQLGL